MGRYYWSKKDEADWLNKLDISWLKAQGYLDGWKSGTITWTRGEYKTSIGITVNVSSYEQSGYANLYYTHTGRDNVKTKIDYKVELTTTPCNFGSVRYWFVCTLYSNGVYCGRRVRTLYCGGKHFGCRHCYNLSYMSRNQNTRYKHFPLFRAIEIGSRIDKLRERIKRSHYGGQPTRLRRRLEWLYRQMAFYSRFL